MSILDLLYLEESQSETAITAVHRWCAEYGFEISSDEGKQAIAVAARLAKSTENSDFLTMLSQEMAAAAQPSSVDLVLVLEDEPFIALDIEDMLKAAGFQTKTCPSKPHWLLSWISS